MELTDEEAALASQAAYPCGGRRRWNERQAFGIHDRGLLRPGMAADVFVFASTTETFGTVVTEAMASGLPAVSYELTSALSTALDSADSEARPRAAFACSRARCASFRFF